MVARSESVGKLWAAKTLSMTYLHGSAWTGPQDASTNPPVTGLIVVPTVFSHAAVPVFMIVTPFSSLSTRSCDSLIELMRVKLPIRIKTVPLMHDQRAALAQIEPQKNDRCQALFNCARHNRF